MPVPAAVPDAPALAVLVLAWDEATPAVRALLEATQARVPVVDSILVMVPQADAPEHLSAEEYLPVPALAPEPTPLPPATPEPEPLPLPVAEPTLPAATSVVGEAINGSLIASSQDASVQNAPLATSAAAPVAVAPLAWTAVRVLRLGSLSLPQLAQRAGQPLPAPVWTGPTANPAAPYLGATVLASLPDSLVINRKSTPNTDYIAEMGLPLGVPVATEPANAPVALPATGVALPRAAPRYEPTEAPQAPDLEADWQPSEADEIADFELAAAASILPESAPSRPDPRPAAQADWAEALATLRQPASLPEPLQLPDFLPETEPAPAPTVHPALRPAATHYPAPDLNFQIIQYARFAVPVALAESSFAVVYAPAWPTWLAAQELRQRTGRPLVLHVSTLAAADDESVETATGWIAELQRQALRRADLLLAETPALAQRLRHDLGLPASAVQAIPAADAAAIAQALHTAQLRLAPTA